MSLATGFSAKTSVLKAHANFDVTGNLTLEYQDGSSRCHRLTPP